MDYLGVMFGVGASAWIDRQGFYFLLTHWLLFLLCVIGSSLRGMNILRLLTGSYESRRIRQIAACVVYIGMFLVSLAFLVTESFHPFLYLDFRGSYAEKKNKKRKEQQRISVREHFGSWIRRLYSGIGSSQSVLVGS